MTSIWICFGETDIVDDQASKLSIRMRLLTLKIVKHSRIFCLSQKQNFLSCLKTAKEVKVHLQANLFRGSFFIYKICIQSFGQFHAKPLFLPFFTLQLRKFSKENDLNLFSLKDAQMQSSVDEAILFLSNGNASQYYC